MTGLIDSNVLIAAADGDHVHHAASLAFVEWAADRRYATASHCLTECYSVLTRGRQSGGSAFTPGEALAALDKMSDAFAILSLTIADHEIALRLFAQLGGTGPRVYDWLIGYVAQVNFIPTLVTRNIRHFSPLFPTLHITLPEEIMES